MTNDATKLEMFGRTMKVMVPSGRVFTIREQNGNDDDVLSNPITMNDLTNIDNFLTGILITEEVEGKETAVTLKTVTELPNNDRYFLLIQSRVFSLGNNLVFTFDWGADNGGKVTYTEDLSKYLHDYTKPFPVKGDSDYFEYKIPPYPANSDIHSKFYFEVTSGKKFRFGLMTRQGEKWMMKLPAEELTRNSELRARNLEYLSGEGDAWVKVENFAMFSKRDLIEIKKAVTEVDPTYQFITEVENPKTGQIINHPMMTSSDFFFPVEI